MGAGNSKNGQVAADRRLAINQQITLEPQINNNTRHQNINQPPIADIQPDARDREDCADRHPPSFHYRKLQVEPTVLGYAPVVNVSCLWLLSIV